MNNIPDEEELTKYLLRSSEFARLPPWAELEPGSFLYYVKDIWEKEQGRDGRRGHLSDVDIAKKISEYTGKKFTRNQFQSIFGAGRKDQKQKPVVTREIAEAFLYIAFTHWSSESLELSDSGEKNYERILPYNTLDINELVLQIVHRMYETDIAVRCVPADGVGPIGFYRRCRKDRSSVIIATQHKHLFIDDPGMGLAEWLDNFRTYFRDIERQKNNPMHIWAVREPIISDDTRPLSSLYDIGLLRTALMVARTMCLSKNYYPTWEKVAKRSMVVVLLNESNNQFRSEQVSYNSNLNNPIQSDFIFPNEVPSVWQSKEDNLSVDGLNFITTINEQADDDLKVGYNIIVHKQDNRTHPVVTKSTPSRDSDHNFRNLYLACKGALSPKNSENERQIYYDAMQNGWRFLTADEFLDHKIL